MGMGYITLRYVNDNGVEKLEVTIEDDSILGISPRPKLDVPNGNYVLTKMP